MSAFDPSRLGAIHVTVLGLLHAANDLLQQAPGIRRKQGAELVANMCSWLFEYHVVDRTAIDFWLLANRPHADPTALEQAVRFAFAVRDAVWPAGQRRPVLRSSGMRPAEEEDLRNRWQTICAALGAVPACNFGQLEHGLEQELLQARTLGSMSEDAVVKAMLDSQPSSKSKAGGDDVRPAQPTRAYCLPRPKTIRWNCSIEVEPRLWHLLGLVLDAQDFRVSFEEVREEVYRGKEVKDPHIRNDISRLNKHLSDILFPWMLTGEGGHVQLIVPGLNGNL